MLVRSASGQPVRRCVRHWTGDKSPTHPWRGSPTVAPQPLYDGRPGLVRPTENGHFVALAGMPGQLYGFQQTASHNRLTWRRWEEMPKAGLITAASRPWVQSCRRRSSASDLRSKSAGRWANCSAESRCRARGGRQRRRALGPLSSPPHLLAGSGFASTRRLGGLAWGPTLLPEVPGLQTSSFFPMAR